jgi:hypothetical protein
MGRLVGWTLAAVGALAISAVPAAAQSWSVGVHIGNGPVYAPGPYYDPYYRPVYRAPVYRVPVYDPYYDPYYYRPVYRSYRPVYRDRVVIVNGRRDNGRHNGWYRDDRRGRGPGWRNDGRGRR